MLPQTVAGIALAVLCIIAVFTLISVYRELARYRNQTMEAYQAFISLLQERNLILSRIIHSLKPYTGQKEDVLRTLVACRNISAGTNDIQEQLNAIRGMNGAMEGMNDIIEEYPHLLQQESFQDDLKLLEQTDIRINYARTYYNSVVKKYNQSISTFPQSPFSVICRFRRAISFPEQVQMLRVRQLHMA